MQTNQTTKEIVRGIYKDDAGNPFELTDGQVEIFEAISRKTYPRLHIMTHTQYGKSDVVALALLTRVNAYPEKWCIVAPTHDKAKIIMGYVIKHLFENKLALSQFKISPDEKLERIRRERSKDRLTFKMPDGFGEIFIISCEATRKGEDAGNKLMGFGAPNVVLDEAGLIPDPIYSKILRMVAGHKENFIAKVGNPFYKLPPYTHFYKSFISDKYHKIVVDIEKSLKEGRITKEFIEEAESSTLPQLFGVLYKCEFPEDEGSDISGYIRLFDENLLKQAQEGEFQHFGPEQLGVDIAGGGKNYSVIVHRSGMGAEVLYRERNSDLMNFCGIVQDFMQKTKISPENVNVDIVGMGKGVYDRLRELGKNINGVNVGQEPFDKLRYDNLKAEAFFKIYEWLKKGGKLKKHESWNELLNIKYKVQSNKTLKIISKQELLKQGIQSPDVADALMLTFCRNEIPQMSYSPKKFIFGVGQTQRERGESSIRGL